MASIETINQCDLYGEILAPVDLRVACNLPERLVDLPGEFWIAIKHEEQITLVASRNGIRQCFYCAAQGKFFYGATVAEVVQAAGIEWQWNWRAVASLSYFGHTLGNDTLGAGVHRVGPGEIVHWDGNQVIVKAAPPRNNDKVSNPRESAVDALVAFIKRYGEDATLPLSAGFDSRLLLAAFLAAGHKPDLFVMGPTEATDVRIATAIANDCGLAIRRVDLPLEEYLCERDTIMRITSGTKTPDNWHTYVGTKMARLSPGTKLFPGANGEFARTFYFDRGWLFHAANLLSRVSVKWLWKSKLERYAKLPPGTNPALTSYFNDKRREVLNWLLEHYGPNESLGDVISKFYLRERVRTFISNGLALYSYFTRPRMPFLDADWISAVEQLPHRDKLYSNWHRYAIGRLNPQLLNYPTDDSARSMAARALFRTRLGLAGKQRSVGYAPNLFQHTAFRAAAIESLGSIDDVFDLAAAKALIEQGENSRSIAFLSSLAFWRDYLRRANTIRTP